MQPHTCFGIGCLALLQACGNPSPPAVVRPVSSGQMIPFPRHGDFLLPGFDTGMMHERCAQITPWGADSWGFEGATFTEPSRPSLARSRFVLDGTSAWLMGREDAGRWGFVRVVQGDVWGGSPCAPIGWHKFAPVLVAGRDAKIRLRINRDSEALLKPGASWAMVALNAWFSSPALASGPDVTGHKPLVMDLVFNLSCNWDGCGLRHYEDDWAWHYQAFVGRAPQGKWESFEVDLARHVQAATSGFRMSQEVSKTLALYQIEFLVELRNAEASVGVSQFAVDVR